MAMLQEKELRLSERLGGRFAFSVSAKSATQVVRLSPSRNAEERFAGTATEPVGMARRGQELALGVYSIPGALLCPFSLVI